MKKIIRCMIICILTISILCCCIRKINVASIIGTDKMKIETCQASFVYNENNLNQLTAFNKYVFVASVTEGELICSAPNTVALLDSDSNYSESEVYKKYVDACEHPEDIDWDKPDEMSRYDVKFKE